MITIREKIISISAEPGVTQAEIAHRVDRSRERVRQVLLEEGIDIPRKRNHCKDCDTLLPPGRSSKYCVSCSQKRKDDKRNQIRQEYTCFFCGGKVIRRKSEAKRNRKVFCNRSCFGRWLGKNFGGGSRKEERMIKYEVVDSEQIPVKGKQSKEAQEIIEALLKLEPNKALKIACSSKGVEQGLKGRVLRRLFILGYRCSTAVRGLEVFFWDVVKVEEPKEE